MKMLYSTEETLRRFDSMMALHNDAPTKEQVQVWVEATFGKPGLEFEDWTPNDWKKDPKMLDKIKEPQFRQWAVELNNIWLDLGRKMIPDVKENPQSYSIIPLDHPVIVPGGRFREVYYWDTYWIIRGLLHSEMYSVIHCDEAFRR